MGPSCLRLAAFAAVWLVAAPAGAEVYRWTDARGKVHYTSDLNDVPVEQREAAKAGAGGTGRGAVMRIEAKPRTQPAASPAAPGAAAPSSQAPVEERYAERNESSWRAEARTYREAIERLEAETEKCTAGEFRRSAGAGGRAEREESAEADACGRMKSELAMNRRWLESFEETAHRAGVPPGWLRD